MLESTLTPIEAEVASSPSSTSMTTHLFRYNQHITEERSGMPFGEAVDAINNNTNTWIHLVGRLNESLLQQLAQKLEIDAPSLQRLISKTKRSSYEVIDKHVVVVLRFMQYSPRSKNPRERSLFAVLDKGYVITITDREDNFFDPIRQRIRNPKGLCRRAGADYLMYMLIDTVVDHYFVWVEKLDVQITQIEGSLMNETNGNVNGRIHSLKKQTAYLRKSMWPLREVVYSLQSADSGLIGRNTIPQFAKVYNQAIQVIETIETQRDILSGMMDWHLSQVSYRLNEIMKVLAVVSTIFVPLTFIVGIYGMNFKHMPELEWEGGYLLVWSSMLLIASAMVYYFRRRRWI